MNILGISAFYHDSAAALVQDGVIAAAAQEERFSRKKHDAGFPSASVSYCLDHAGLTTEDLDYVVFYEKPLLKFDRLLETYLAFAPRGIRSFSRALPLWLKEKLFIQKTLDRELSNSYRGRYVFLEHHESHAASAFFPSPFEEAAILTVDGVGEWATATIGTGRSNRIELIRELRFPHSLGLLYSAFTYYTGFKVNSGEYKLMGLAPYGEPRFADLIRTRLLDIKPDGSFWMNQDYFNYCQGLTMTGPRFHQLFGAPPRTPESPLTQFHMDLAASIQKVTEEILLRMARFALQETGMKNLCLAGGVALNCVANGEILREGGVDHLWIQPAGGDAGGALGAALFTWYQLLQNPRQPEPDDAQAGTLLGPEYTEDSIARFLDSVGARCDHIEDLDELQRSVAQLIESRKVVGWFQGRMEFGPRALGNRSILGDARSPEMQKQLNLKIKFRESFRPFAPAVLRERASEFFGLSENTESPYMLLVADVRDVIRTDCLDQLEQSTGFDKLPVCRSEIPAVTHVDFSARVQTVDQTRNPRFHGLLRAFETLSGNPVVINTSFNVRGEPIVCTPEDAYRCFMATDMDVLVLGDYLLRKEDQPAANRVRTREHLSRFDLD